MSLSHKKITIFGLMFLLTGTISAPISYGQIYRADFENFKKYNPDVDKYDYVKDFLLALDHIYRNQQSYGRLDDGVGLSDDKLNQIKNYIDHLKQSNMQYRMAKNLLRNFENSKNGLILESRKIFIEGCDKVVSWNNKEREILTAYYESAINNADGSLDFEALKNKQESISVQRKESNKRILESALIIKKILISNKPNSYGEFVYLGITEIEREKLLRRIEGQFGNGYDEGVQEGQTVFEASVSVIREMLQDYTRLSIDS